MSINTILRMSRPQKMQTPRDKRALRRSGEKDSEGHGIVPVPKRAKRNSVDDGRGAHQAALDALKLEYAQTLSTLDERNEQLSTSAAELEAGQLRQARMLEQQKTFEEQNKNLHEEQRALESKCLELKTQQQHLQADIDTKKTEFDSLQKAVGEAKQGAAGGKEDETRLQVSRGEQLKAEQKKMEKDARCKEEVVQQVQALKQREALLSTMQAEYNTLKTKSQEIEISTNYIVSCLCFKVQNIATEYENLISDTKSVASAKREEYEKFEAIRRDCAFMSQKKEDLIKTIRDKTNETLDEESKHEALKGKYKLEIKELEERKIGLVASIEENTKTQTKNVKAAQVLKEKTDAMSERAMQAEAERILLKENWEREMGRQIIKQKSIERDIQALQYRKALLVSDCKEIEDNTCGGLKENVDRVLGLMKKHNACASLREKLSSRLFADSPDFKSACHEILKIRFEECWKSRRNETGAVSANAISQRVLWHQNGKVYCPIQLARDSFRCQATVTTGDNKVTNEKTLCIKNLQTADGSFFLSAYFYVHPDMDSMFLNHVRAAAKQVNKENLLWGFNDCHLFYADERCQFEIFLAEWNKLNRGRGDDARRV